MVVAILAIWKTGGTYVPLDPAYPEERLTYMISDARVHTLLIQEALLERIPKISGDMIVIDRDWDIIQTHGSTNPERELIPRETAYLIYTSGSTGRPKGVMISHNSFAEYCQTMRDHWLVREDDRILQLASICFDVSLAEIFIELISGGSTVLPSGDFIVAQRLSELISKRKITRINLAPVLWRQWVQSLVTNDARYDFPELRIVVVGSDKLPPDVVHMWNELPISRNVRLVNAYGPTESTVTTTTYWSEPDLVPEPFPIGRPLPGIPHYILDPLQEPVPVGVFGELHLGGDRLAKGYINRPELTENKFVPDPFCAKEGSRMYKTGDLVRFLSDGNIEFLGRVDHQVKIRGYRVEPGELEFALSKHPSIKEAAVKAIEFGTEEKYLVAYIVPKNKDVATSDLRAYLKKKLPEYMLPWDFIPLDSLPLNPNGKVDRDALPVPDQHSGDADAVYVAPRNPIEEKIADIWKAILGVSAVGVNDNFFALGGHSINAAQIISRVRDEFEIDLSIATMFDIENLAEMAEIVSRQSGF